MSHDEEKGDDPVPAISPECSVEGAPAKKVRLSTFQGIVLNFTTSWFTFSMGTGIVAVMLRKLPYQFTGLDIIAHVVFVFHIVTFLIIIAISTLRYLWWPRVFLLMLNHPIQSLFLGAIPIAVSTVVDYLVIALVPYWGQGLAIFAWVLWWINIALAFGIAISLAFIQFTRHANSLETFNALWLLPIVCIIAAAGAGSIVASVIPMQHGKLTIVLSYVALGMGFSLAFMVTTIYYMRLMIHKIPLGGSVFSAFLPLSVFSQSAFATLNLASTARDVFKKHGEWIVSPNVISSDTAGFYSEAMYAGTIPISLMLWGFALIWLVLAIFFIIDIVSVSKISFTLAWWGVTFPVGVFAVATSEISNSLGSGFFRVLATIITLGEIMTWLMMVALTLYNLPRNRLFIAPYLQEDGGIPPVQDTLRRKYEF